MWNAQLDPEMQVVPVGQMFASSGLWNGPGGRISGWALAWTKIPQDSPCLAYEIYEFIKQT